MFSRLGRRLRAFVKDAWEILTGPIHDFIADMLPDAFNFFAEKILGRRSPDSLERYLARIIGIVDPKTDEEVREALNEFGPLARLILLPFLVPGFTLPILNARLTSAITRIEQAERTENPILLPDPNTIGEAVNRIAIDYEAGQDALRRYGLAREWADVVIRMAKRKIDAGTIAEAVRRGLLNYDDGAFYAATAGIDGNEFSVLFNLTRRLLTAAELVNAAYRGVISYDDARNRAAQVGVEPSDFDILFRAARQLMPVGDLVNAWLRGIMSTEALEANLAAHGFEKADIDAIKELAFFIPPPSDLIRMAVREVFTPEVAERFGQFEDFPEAFKEWAAKQGISEFWARAYWAAHWDLPSATQGFEMFHREIISEDELKMLLRALDVMPFWRDRLIKLSYNPVTRIDILRMYQLGVIGPDEVERRFRHLGYSPEDAKVLAEYTIKLAAQREKDLSRTDIEALLEAGTISHEQARTLLLRAGYTEEIADLIMARIDLKLAQRDVEDEIEVIKTRFLTGEIDLTQVASELSQLELPGTAISRIMAQLERERRKRRRSLSPAQIRDALRRGVITEDQAFSRLTTMGYPPEDARILIELYKAGGE